MDTFRGFDVFEQRLTFSHNNRLRYKSCLGSVFSICIFALMLTYFIILLVSPMKLVETTTSTNQVTAQNESEVSNSTTDTTGIFYL